MIRKVRRGYAVTSESGKNLGGPYKSKKQANKRLQQVEYFKYKKMPSFPYAGPAGLRLEQ